MKRYSFEVCQIVLDKYLVQFFEGRNQFEKLSCGLHVLDSKFVSRSENSKFQLAKPDPYFFRMLYFFVIYVKRMQEKYICTEILY